SAAGGRLARRSGMAAPSAASRPHAPRNQRKSERTQTSTDTNSAEPSEAAAGEGKDPVTKKVVTVSDGEEALALLAEESFDLVLSDVRMPRLDGWGFLDALSERNRPPVVIMMSAYGDRDAALNVMKLGAYDYVSKPFTTEDVLLTLRKAEERERLRRDNTRLKEDALRQFSFENILARSAPMLEIFAIIRKIADYKTTVLIMGESGTGKELIARALHFNSPRRENPFVAVNCGAIPADLLESELFGHVRG